jgi:hypothetical protein
MGSYRASWESCWLRARRRQAAARAGSFAEPRLGPAAAARSERSQARRAAASTVANRQVQRRRLVVGASPRPSDSGGAPIERADGDDSEAESEGPKLTPRNVVYITENVGDDVTPAALVTVALPQTFRNERSATLIGITTELKQTNPALADTERAWTLALFDTWPSWCGVRHW